MKYAQGGIRRQFAANNWCDIIFVMSKKETTIDDLAGMIKKGFVGVDKHLLTI